MENNFIYNLSETEYLVFKPQRDHFELFSGHEGSATNSKLATYKGGRWVFEDYTQKKLFWFLFNIYKKDFGKALKRAQEDRHIRTIDIARSIKVAPNQVARWQKMKDIKLSKAVEIAAVFRMTLEEFMAEYHE